MQRVAAAPDSKDIDIFSSLFYNQLIDRGGGAAGNTSVFANGRPPMLKLCDTLNLLWRKETLGIKYDAARGCLTLNLA
jgi:hypothetical protein